MITFVCSPNNPTGRAESPETVAHVLDRAPGLVVVDEAYGQFAPWSALELLRGGGPGAERLVVVRTFSKTWSMAACRLGYLVADPDVVAACDAVALPYHLDAMTQLAGRLALRHVGRHGGSGWRCSPRSGVASPPPWRPGRRVVALGRQLHPVPAHRPGRHREVWQDLLGASVLVRDCSTWPGLDECLRVTVGTPRGERPVPGRVGGGARGGTMTDGSTPRAPRTAAARATDQGDRRSRWRSTSTGPGRVEVTTGLPVLRPHAVPARPPRRAST